VTRGVASATDSILIASVRLDHLRKRLRFAQAHGTDADILILAEAVAAAWAVLKGTRGY
jgi:hypothetical protein